MRKKRQNPTNQERERIALATKMMVSMAPDENAAGGIIIGVVNTIMQIWGKEEAMSAAETFEPLYMEYQAREGSKPQGAASFEATEPQDAMTLLATEGLLKRSRN
jgi:hypothetical protein